MFSCSCSALKRGVVFCSWFSCRAQGLRLIIMYMHYVDTEEIRCGSGTRDQRL